MFDLLLVWGHSNVSAKKNIPSNQILRRFFHPPQTRKDQKSTDYGNKNDFRRNNPKPSFYRKIQYREEFPRWLGSKRICLPMQIGRRYRRHWFDPWVRKILWRRKWQPIPVFLPGESHGQRIWWASVHGATKSRTQPSD